MTLGQVVVYYSELADSGDRVAMSDSDQKAFSAKRKGERRRWTQYAMERWGNG
jgi:hypothetical protein